MVLPRWDRPVPLQGMATQEPVQMAQEVQTPSIPLKNALGLLRMRSKLPPHGRVRKKRSYAALKRSLDQIFSLWTRRRFSEDGLTVRCCTCGVIKPIAAMQCGHFQKRHYLATRWEPANNAPQCPSCNIFKSGAMAEYAAWGVDRYGMDWPARMVALSRVPTKYSRSDLEALIAEYEEKLKVLTAGGAVAP